MGDDVSGEWGSSPSTGSKETIFKVNEQAERMYKGAEKKKTKNKTKHKK